MAAEASAEVSSSPSSPSSSSSVSLDKFVSRVPDLVFESKQQPEGDGASVRRSIGSFQLRNFDPFLMLDEFDVKRPGGFPTHPHRGFETVTYMLNGVMTHEDFKGHRGSIGPGEVQWMTAGKGILHSEIPGKEGAHGMQLWINLAAKDKMCKPAYQEGKPKTVTQDGITATVISGEALGLKSKTQTRTPASYIHFKMEPNKQLVHPIDSTHNAFVYTLAGAAYFGGKPSAEDKEGASPFQKKPAGSQKVRAHFLATLTRDEELNGLLVTTKDQPVDFVLITGKPLGEPVVQHGPFVMNTREQIIEAIRDYQNARGGFERKPGWTASIDELRMDF